MNKNTISAVLIITYDFDTEFIRENYSKSFSLYYGAKDSRVDAFEASINQTLSQIQIFLSAAEATGKNLLDILKKATETLPSVEKIEIGTAISSSLSPQ